MNDDQDSSQFYSSNLSIDQLNRFDSDDYRIDQVPMDLEDPLNPSSGLSQSDQQDLQEASDREDNADSSRVDDAAKESTALSVYRETHPDHDQLEAGGREIADHEAIWGVSSFRPPHWGLDKLRDNNPLTYWQSDCPNPRLDHTIDIYFHKATFVRQVSLFIDFFQDESYTPKTVSVRGGLTYRNLQDIEKIECGHIVGWVNIDITQANDGKPFRLFYLQICILSTHLNGRDTHIRQVKVYSGEP
ncbi:anaphase-promoting complex, subunit 10-domain-containing protein [Choanephora cucurbitarum]|nr:anaphase-promoting complex, subunit 10-domain-containing protein [Choanephora cucurbitarum]